MDPDQRAQRERPATGSSICWNMCLYLTFSGVTQVRDVQAADGRVEDLDGVGQHHRVP